MSLAQFLVGISDEIYQKLDCSRACQFVIFWLTYFSHKFLVIYRDHRNSCNLQGNFSYKGSKSATEYHFSSNL